MDSKITKDLAEAYNSIYLQENVEKRNRESVKSFMNFLVNEGYDVSNITEDDIYEFCLNEGIDLNEAGIQSFGQLAKAIEKAKGVVTSPATRQAATGLLQTGQKVVQQTAGPVLSGVTRRVQSAAQTGQQAVQQAAQAAAKGPKGPFGQALSGIKRTAELATGMAPGSGSRLRRSLMVGATGGVLGSTGLGQKALETLGRLRVSLDDGKPKAEAPKPPSQGDTKKKEWDKLKEDYFDLIKGHLLDEGYASTEKQAIAIMSNMSETWKNSIIENHIQK